MLLHITETGKKWLEQYKKRKNVDSASNIDKALTYLVLIVLEEEGPMEELNIARAARKRATSISGDIVAWDIDFFYPMFKKLTPTYIAFCQEDYEKNEESETIYGEFGPDIDVGEMFPKEERLSKEQLGELRAALKGPREVTREEKLEAEQDIAAMIRQRGWENREGIEKSPIEERWEQKEFDRLWHTRFGSDPFFKF